MVRSLLLTFALMLSGTWLLAQTALSGRVMDTELPGEGLFGATVKILNGTDVVGGAVTDLDGYFRLTIDPGTYDVEISYTGYATARVESVKVLSNQENKLLTQEMSTSSILDEVVVTFYKVPLVQADQTSGGQTLTSDQIRNLPTRSVNAIVATTAGTSSIDGGAVNIKGSRSNATNYYVDGIRVSANTVQVQDIEQLQVVTGGLGAEYGDVTGGVISITTKGPANEYHGAIEAETSEFLDPYGWNLASVNVSGPLLRKKNAVDGSSTSVIGFRLSGQYRGQKDDDPPATNVYRAKESVLANLAANPLQRVGTSLLNAAENLTRDSVDVYNYRPFENRTDYNLTGKLDFRLNSAIDMSVTGTFERQHNRFTPMNNSAGPTSTGWAVENWTLLNSQNNPYDDQDRYLGIFRFRHRLGNTTATRDSSSSNRVQIVNTSYTLQAGYEKRFRKIEDFRHEDRLFDYGYVGQFDFVPVPVIGQGRDGLIEQVDWRYDFQQFTPGTVNPGAAAYNNLANPESFQSYVYQNGRWAQDYRRIWGGQHANINQIHNTYNKEEDDILTFSGKINFEMNFGSRNSHSIQIGVLQEQRNIREFRVNPRGLWDLANQRANNHFNGLNYNIVVDSIPGPFGDMLPVYAPAYVDQEDNKFYRKIRETLGVGLDEYVNVNGLTPDQLSLSQFTPFELTNNADYINYYGFNYTGEKLNRTVTFNDFFTSRDADGLRDFPVAPIQPIYQAAFIKDKFTFNEMIFSLGMRVERFDLNTKTPKDPYSLYEVISASEFHALDGTGTRPATIGDDYKVYVSAPGDKVITAYRDGNVWYDATGNERDGSQIFGGGVVTPYLKDDGANANILDPNFDPNSAFQDYKPQVNWMPRLAFSFPISDDANFFAHYDILVQRPPSNFEVTAFNYLNFYTANRTPLNNPNLLPEKVIDYEVGFQQKLNQYSAVKFSAYYREMRDMIQRQTILYVPTIGRYDTYGNIDFGTTKGFTFQYDLRRIANVEMRLAYTLQFADGTGSDANSSRGLTSRGNIRNLSPLNFDERHSLNGILDYRFPSGDAYFGPVVAGKDILSNFGANLQFFAVSGRPYSARQIPDAFGAAGFLGAINGSSKPWRFNMDLRLDKSFTLAGNGKNPLNMNVYFRISNLLNRKNVVNVYEFTGSPNDDGYLSSAQGQSILNGISAARSLDAYLASYSFAMLNPDNYTQPRRMYLGATFEF